ncbi:hypothetical protein [Paraflavitalea sp. CAU 1676]|uniref:hypothetical protein n=1 Tax=Paraflavitalea sp. CAU 1676 TaxID=3032598 RepID=UPI0023DBEB2E|nr:hypothetical protein [Paraflavitalea sp. CAU 1676]MDF2192371.1 hypothetical protein [Paraflavitalea sp. CAU 1676]
MTLKLTHTTGVKIDGKKCTVYQLFEEGVLVGEYCSSGKRTFIKYNDTTIEIRDVAPWYSATDIVFVDPGTETTVGNYYKPGYRYEESPFVFLLNEEEWIVREMTPRELEARSASYWGGYTMSSGHDKWMDCTFSHPPPQDSIWGPYIERVGTIEANGRYLAPILLSIFVFTKIEDRKNSD